MTLHIDINERSQEAVLIPGDIAADEWDSLIRILGDFTPVVNRVGDVVSIPWRGFVLLKLELAKFVKSRNVKLTISDAATSKLTAAVSSSYSTATQRTTSLSPDEVRRRLSAVGFVRKLTDNQLNNLCRIGPLPAGATFSVPGAGKTTEALAYFFLNAAPDDRLLVVAPKNAFGAWDEQLVICVPNEPSKSFCRLRGGERAITAALKDNPRFMLITYQQYPRVKELIERMLLTSPVFMFLDESHRIKSGSGGVWADAILDSSCYPKRKLIMSGTPMPQSRKDLIPQLNFLYPDMPVAEDTVVNVLQPIYVRTTKGMLGLPEVDRRCIRLKMPPLQAEIYRTLRSEAKRQLLPMLSDASKFSLREIGKKTVKLLQFVSNPALLAGDMQYAFDRRLGELLLKTNGPKIDYACKRARELASQGHKVLIWSGFIGNVQLLTERLSDLGADCIHGGIEAGDEDENDTREWKIKEFHTNPDKWVLVANPAAASEGISLHRVCHHAIYVDRSFNAAQYLQSEDRIHRLGLLPGQEPHVEILECEGSIDQVVRDRLQRKVTLMSNALNDPSLNVDAIPYDFEVAEDEVLNDDDAKAVLAYFFGGVDR